MRYPASAAGDKTEFFRPRGPGRDQIRERSGSSTVFAVKWRASCRSSRQGKRRLMGIKFNEVLANVRWPVCYKVLKLCGVIREQRARGFLKVRQISSDCRHEMISSILQLSQALTVSESGASGCINELSQRR